MSSFLWSSGFGAHKYKLSFPTIADVIDIADYAFARASSILVDDTYSVPVPSPMTTDNSERSTLGNKDIDPTKAFTITLVLNVANEQTEDAEPTHLVEETTNVDTSMPAINTEKTDEPTIPVAASNDDFPTFAPDEKVHSYLHVVPTIDIVEINDTRTSITKGHVYPHVAPIIDIVEINNTAAPNSEVHSYHHCAPLLEIVEIGNTSSPSNAAQPASDVGASASSVDYNNFERFLDEDRMWGIHRPATRKPSKVVGKKKIVPSVKVDEKWGKEVAVGASAAATNAPKGAVHTCTSSHPLQPDDISSQRMRKPSTDTDVSTSTCQTVDTDKPSSDTVTTIPDTNFSCSDVTSDAKSDAQPAQPFIIPWIALTEPSEISLEDANDIKSALQSDNGIPTKESLPSFTALYDYAPLNFTQEDLDNLWIMTILTRPGHAIKYAKVNCGFWYILEDEKNVRMMVEHEYQAFLEWIDEANVAYTVNDQNNEPKVDANGRPQYLDPKWTPKPAD